MKNFRKLAMALAAIMVAAGGIQACGGDDANPLLVLLGEYSGPSNATAVGYASTYCTSCDGVITPPVSSVKGFAADDDDYDALLGGILGTAFKSIYFDTLQNTITGELADQATDHFDGIELAPGQRAYFGPLYAQVDLDDACAPGTGDVFVGVRDGFEGYPEMMAGEKGAGWGEFFYRQLIYDIRLNNCEFTGDLLGAMDNSVVTLSGRLVLTNVVDQIDTFEDWSADGLILINPGESEPMVTGTDPTPVWGYSTPLRFDLEGHWDSLGAFDTSEGGVCYDGLNASSAEACNGVFLDADGFQDILYD